MAHGQNYEIIAPRSKFYQGPFGRICGDLPSWRPKEWDPNKDPAGLDAHFLKVANTEMVEHLNGEDEPVLPDEIASDPEIVKDLGEKFDSEIPAGYTYFGQFVDHDITFDPASSLMRQTDPSGLLNHRTPRLDLDNLYGRGPADSPYLYDQEDRRKLPNGERRVDKFLIGKIEGSDQPDLPRSTLDKRGRALIGDMRNDENAMVSQLQLAFLLAHNNLAQRAREADAKDSFAEARRVLTWLYQWIVWNDFLVRITNDQIHAAALKLTNRPLDRKTWELGLKDVYNWKHQPFMPVEFSVAAYRFGHSMVRNEYQTNFAANGLNRPIAIFDQSGDPDDPASRRDLSGFRPMSERNRIQWDWFLEMESSSAPLGFPQRARKIDTKLANALVFLREEGPNMNVLAYRNLLRGVRLGLPSGTDVAKKWCIDPIAIEQDHDSLWFYILKEAAGPTGRHGQMLGRVGSTIVCATFAGLLLGDPCSWFNLQPCWKPDKEPLLEEGKLNRDKKKWGLQSIIRLAGIDPAA